MQTLASPPAGPVPVSEIVTILTVFPTAVADVASSTMAAAHVNHVPYLRFVLLEVGAVMVTMLPAGVCHAALVPIPMQLGRLGARRAAPVPIPQQQGPPSARLAAPDPTPPKQVPQYVRPAAPALTLLQEGPPRPPFARSAAPVPTPKH